MVILIIELMQAFQNNSLPHPTAIGPPRGLVHYKGPKWTNLLCQQPEWSVAVGTPRSTTPLCHTHGTAGEEWVGSEDVAVRTVLSSITVLAVGAPTNVVLGLIKLGLI